MVDFVKSYKSMRKTAHCTWWDSEKAKHKQQKQNSKAKSKVKDHILKKCLWFYKFENIFHKHLTISSLILINWNQPARRDGASINDSDLGEFDSDQKKTLEANGEVEDMELRLSLDNHDGKDIILFFLKLHRMSDVMRYKNNRQMQNRKKKLKKWISHWVGIYQVKVKLKTWLFLLL